LSRGRASSSGAKMASPPEERERWVCPIDECRESAVHPLDGCKGFGDLSVTKRRKMLKERNLCECCLTDCKDKETGARCYRQTGFRRHHLLRLAVQQEVTSTERREAGVAPSHQESTLAGYQSHASGSNAVGETTECHRDVPGVAEVIRPSAAHTVGRGSRDAGMLETKRRAGELFSQM
jgi:hypothetical protein